MDKYSVGHLADLKGRHLLVYRAEDVDAKLKEYEQDNLALSESATKLCARIDSLETIIETQRQRIMELEVALRIIAGEEQCADSLMSNADVARAALQRIL